MSSAEPEYSDTLKEFVLYPWHHGRPLKKDPTYGRIDRDIQWYVDKMEPESVAQRVAMEQTLQTKRDNSA